VCWCAYRLAGAQTSYANRKDPLGDANKSPIAQDERQVVFGVGLARHESLLARFRARP
jgi:hypothetical protein